MTAHDNWVARKYMQATETWNPKFKNLSEGLTRQIGTSQNGEDGLIEAIFEVCKPQNKWAVECGAGNGKDLSNTWYFLKKLGWSGVLIENDYQYNEALKAGSDPDQAERVRLFPNLSKEFESMPNVHTVLDSVMPDNLTSILDKYNVPSNFDLLSIDIDSPHDDLVWANLKKYKPNLVCIEIDAFEDDPNIFSYQPIIVESDGRVGGHSLAKIMKIAKDKGYDFICANYCNAFFIEKEFGKPLLI